MMKMLGGLARVAGTGKCARFAPVALGFLPALGLAIPLMLADTSVALAKRSYEFHQSRGHNSHARKVRRHKQRSYAKFSKPMKLGAAVHAHDSANPREKGVQVASMGPALGALPETSEKPSSEKPSGFSRISWGHNAKESCLPSRLKPILSHVAETFGTVRVNSTCRSREHNRRVGGASRSYHLISQAVDFKLHGNISGALRYLRTTSAGGIKHYGGGVFHIDTGPRRTW